MFGYVDVETPVLAFNDSIDDVPAKLNGDTLPKDTMTATAGLPVGPVNPMSPVGPIKPVGPVPPTPPVGPVVPVGPVSPVYPVGPV
jgi:hypothetical protein